MSDPRRMAEYQLQLYVVGLLRYSARRDVVWFAVPNGEWRTPAAGARLKATGVVAGVADLVLVIKGRAHFLELKTATGRQSREQVAFALAAVHAGGLYEIATSPEQAKQTLARWGALRPDSVGDIVKRMVSA
jgi:hypothetical protein